MVRNIALTVGELKTILQSYHDDMILTIHREGKGHDYAVYKEDIRTIQNPYFANCDVDNEPFEDELVLQIGMI